jgi:phage terminase large subunit
MPDIQINAVYQQLFNDRGFLRDDVRYFIIYGGRRSGKSHDVAQIVNITAGSQPRHFVPIVRKVGATTKDSIYAEYNDFFVRNNIPTRKNVTDREIVLPNKSRIRAFGLDDPEKLKSLMGATIMHIEEANELSEDDFDSIDAGLSPGEYPGRIILTFNPIPQIPGSLHWLQRRFLNREIPLSKAQLIDTPTGKALILRTWYKDNAFCPEATKTVLEGYKETNPEKYKLWALGEFTALEGCVFKYNLGDGPGWDIVKKVPDEIIHDSIGIGLDFGFSNDPSAAMRLWIREREIWAKQLVYKTDLHNDALYSELITAGVGEYEKVSADSARPDIISDLERLGLHGIAGVKKRANYKEDVATRLQGYKIHFIEGDTDAIREVSTYSWARDKNGKQIPKLQDGDDHCLDAIIMRVHEYDGDVDPWSIEVVG